MERGISQQDLYPALAGLVPDAVSNADKHPNVAGNAAILNALWPVTGQWLLAQGLAGAPGEPGVAGAEAPAER